MNKGFFNHCKILTLLSIFFATSLHAAVLPEERIDLLYHGYDGGGAEIDGPSILVRKNIGNRVSVWGNYYEDVITSASVDVLTQGSPYEEEREEVSAGADYLHNKTLLSLSYTNSSENDYEAETVGFSLSQDFFGDLTTLSIKYSIGNDEVRQNVRENGVIVDANVVGEAEHRRFGVSLTQILTKNLIASFSVESVVDEGFLNNPYRAVRFFSNPEGTQLSSVLERYPTTRSSDAFAIRALYYLPYRASLKGEYRTFSDTFGITADNFDFKYIHPYKNWQFELRYRLYSQTEADFFEDVFTLAQAQNQNFLASDKELDALTSTSIGIGVSYEVKTKYLSWFDRTTVNLFWDTINFEYENYRDRTQSVAIDGPAQFAPGQEPLYSFDADIVRLFISFWY